ncbi:methyltransferase domain-containing protein [Candidatus Omnitrophota bacterium]
MDNELVENHKKYLERLQFYKNFGYDIEKERSFIFEKAQPLYGDMLEVGTGKGYFTVELAKEGHSFTSIDISDEEQKLARLNIKQHGLDNLVRFKIEDAEHLSFCDSSFDIIFSINTLHHLANPFKVIDELIRVVTLEGKIIISDFTEEGFALISKSHATEGKKHDSGRITLLKAGGYFSDKGFKIEKHRDTFQKVIVAYQQTV